MSVGVIENKRLGCRQCDARNHLIPLRYGNDCAAGEGLISDLVSDPRQFRRGKISVYRLILMLCQTEYFGHGGVYVTVPDNRGTRFIYIHSKLPIAVYSDTKQILLKHTTNFSTISS